MQVRTAMTFRLATASGAVSLWTTQRATCRDDQRSFTVNQGQLTVLGQRLCSA